jgi:hypothetical protein
MCGLDSGGVASRTRCGGMAAERVAAMKMDAGENLQGVALG